MGIEVVCGSAGGKAQQKVSGTILIVVGLGMRRRWGRAQIVPGTFLLMTQPRAVLREAIRLNGHPKKA